MNSTLIEKHDLNNIIKIRRIVKSTPNDMQLGKSIRSLIIDSTNVDSTNDENDKE